MRPDILPIDPLTQVVFIHDYLQLLFQEACFSIYNSTELKLDNVSVQFGQPGFCEALVSLIGQSLKSVSVSPSLNLLFQGGAVLIVARSGTGPEAWQYSAPSGPIVVEQNA